MRLPPSHEDVARRIADRVFAPEVVADMDAIKAQHLVVNAAQVLLSNKDTRNLGLALFTVAAWLIPEDQRKTQTLE